MLAIIPSFGKFSLVILVLRKKLCISDVNKYLEIEWLKSYPIYGNQLELKGC